MTPCSTGEQRTQRLREQQRRHGVHIEIVQPFFLTQPLERVRDFAIRKARVVDEYVEPRMRAAQSFREPRDFALHREIDAMNGTLGTHALDQGRCFLQAPLLDIREDQRGALARESLGKGPSHSARGSCYQDPAVSKALCHRIPSLDDQAQSARKTPCLTSESMMRSAPCTGVNLDVSI